MNNSPYHSKCLNDKIYLTYNEINKEYEVYILTEDEYNQLSKKQQKEVGHMILIKRTKNPGPPSPPAWFSYWCEHVFNPTISKLEQAITDVRQEVADVRTELKQDIADVRQEVADVRTELKQDIANVRQEVADVRTELKQDIANVRQEVAKVNLRLDNILLKNNLVE